MSVIVIAEHDNSKLRTFSLNAISAASKIDSDIHVLVAGNKCENVSKEVAAIPLVKKVLQLDAHEFEYQLAESVAPVIINIADQYSHLLAPATTYGKNIMPRV